MKLILKFAELVTKLIFRLTLTILAVSGVIAICVSLLLLAFFERSERRNIERKIPSTVVVFTGQYDRIYKGIELLSSGTSDTLFVTGANRKAGIHVDRFSSQFGLTPQQAKWIEEDKILLAPDARDTLENALEASCWLERQRDIEAVALITSQRHMARASIALEHAIAPIKVVRIMSDEPDNYDKLQLDLVEFGKFVATWAVTLLPYDFWPSDKPSTCL